MMIMIPSVPTKATPPATGPISILTISPRERPSRRIEQEQDYEVLHSAGKDHSTKIQSVPGR